MMSKPVKPAKKMEVAHSSNFYFDHVSNKVSLGHFLDWIKQTVPHKAQDITISLDPIYGDLERETMLDVSIEVGWKELIKNPRYAKEMKRYHKQLGRWKKGR